MTNDIKRLGVMIRPTLTIEYENHPKYGESVCIIARDEDFNLRTSVKMSMDDFTTLTYVVDQLMHNINNLRK